MHIKTKHWIIFIVLSVLAFTLWRHFTYPQFSFINLSIDRPQALQISRSYLAEKYNVNPDRYTSATVFSGRQSSDRYLQKSLGFAKELEFFKKYDFELFFWKTRFFKENKEEQFFITVSAATGEVVSFAHHIPATAARKDYGRDKARHMSIDFLKSNFGFNPEEYILLTNLAQIHDNRTNYSFEWAKKDVFIPWDENPAEHGGGKLLTGITVAGDEVLSFTKNKLKIPDKFNRHIKRIQNVGKNLGVLFRFTFFFLLAASTFYIIVRRNNILLHVIKIPCLAATAVLFIFEIILYLNGLEYILFDYPTTSSFPSYFWRFFSNQMLDTFMVTITFLMPVLAGEALHYEVFPKKRDKTLLHHIQSTFVSRNVSALILMGYLTALILLGMQSLLFHIGETYLGVWAEYRWMTSFSASYFPFIPALVIALSASLTEEAMFRLFGISLGKKLLKNTAAAVLLSSIIWGYGHSGYPIFPMWFRGLEVSFLGIFISVVYLKFGLIPVIIAHYLFDAFWCTANFTLGTSSPLLFYSALSILIAPLAFAAIAFIVNREEHERPMLWRLSAKQKFNLVILKHYLKDHPQLNDQSRQDCIQKIAENGWDIAVVETAFDELKLNE